jgi:hypothetical protein
MMTPKQFRRLALSLPEAIESAHMNHPDFRVKGKIFATLSGDEKFGMVKLTPEQQADLLQAEPEAYEPAAGAWGARGCTMVRLKMAKQESVGRALLAAWRNVAPKVLVKEGEDTM